MSVIQLKGTRRENVGTGFARKARAAGQIPGVV
jgi:ribosomal protein L25 (general stress protein Ctc)